MLLLGLVYFGLSLFFQQEAVNYERTLQRVPSFCSWHAAAFDFLYHWSTQQLLLPKGVNTVFGGAIGDVYAWRRRFWSHNCAPIRAASTPSQMSLLEVVIRTVSF